MLNLKNIAEEFERLSFKKFTLKTKEIPLLNSENENGENILFFMNDLKKIKYLILECGIPCHTISKDKMSPLWFKGKEAVKYMTGMGGVINVDVMYSTPMDFATPEEARGLLAKGYNVNECLFNQYMTKLTYEEEVEKLNILIEHGLDMSQLSPLIYLTEKRFLDVLNGYNIKANIYIESLKNTEEDSYFFIKMLDMGKEDNLQMFVNNHYSRKEQREELIKRVILNSIPLVTRNVFNNINYECIFDSLVKYTKFDPHSFEISWKPWFFCFNYLDIKNYLDTKNIDVYKKTSAGKTYLFHLDDLDCVYQLCKENCQFLLEKDNRGDNFAQSGYAHSKMRLLEEYIEYPIEKWNIEFSKIFFEECVKPLLEGEVNFMKREVMEKPGVAILVSQWEKEVLLSDMKNKVVQLKKVNQERI